MSSAQVSLHLQRILERAEEFQSKCPLPDRFPPRLEAEDGEHIASLIGPQMSYYFTTKVFIKRQPHQDELGLDVHGNPAINSYIADRLRNEAASLQFIAEHTTIPVPKFLDLWVDNGLVYLKTALVDEGVELQQVDDARIPAAVAKVSKQLEQSILPQLRGLRRNLMGSPSPELPVIPPNRLWSFKESRVWPPTVKDMDEYVFCHTDLDRQNIFVDPKTYDILSIIDWETAGYFPQGWELPYWTADSRRGKFQMSNEVRDCEIALFDFPE